MYGISYADALSAFSGVGDASPVSVPVPVGKKRIFEIIVLCSHSALTS